MSKEMTTKDFVITREFKAPRKLVFQVWTDPKHLLNWMGPKGSKYEYVKADLRAGGTVHYKTYGPGNTAMYGMAEYTEISPIEKIIYVQYFSDEKGSPVRHPMSTTWPLKMNTTVIFKDKGSNTEITLTWSPINPNDVEAKTFTDAMPGMTQGWGGSFEVLDQYLSELNK